MNITIFDIEVFKYDWIAVFYDVSTDSWSVFHNDNDGFRNHILRQNHIYGGVNNKHYDNHIVKAICCGAEPTLLKEI